MSTKYRHTIFNYLLYISESSVNIHTLKWPSLLAVTKVGFSDFSALQKQRAVMWSSCGMLTFVLRTNLVGRKPPIYFLYQDQYDRLSYWVLRISHIYVLYNSISENGKVIYYHPEWQTIKCSVTNGHRMQRVLSCYLWPYVTYINIEMIMYSVDWWYQWV